MFLVLWIIIYNKWEWCIIHKNSNGMLYINLLLLSQRRHYFTRQIQGARHPVFCDTNFIYDMVIPKWHGRTKWVEYWSIINDEKLILISSFIIVSCIFKHLNQSTHFGFFVFILLLQYRRMNCITPEINGSFTPNSKLPSFRD